MPTAAHHKSAEAFLEAYLRELSAVGGRSPYTIRNYRTDIGSFLAWCADHDLEPLRTTRQVFREYLTELKDSGMVAASITRRTSTVHGFYKYLHREGATERDLLYGVALPKRPKRLPKVLDPALLDALLAAPDPSTPQGLRDRAMFELLYGGGLRHLRARSLDMVRSRARLDRCPLLWGMFWAKLASRNSHPDTPSSSTALVTPDRPLGQTLIATPSAGIAVDITPHLLRPRLRPTSSMAAPTRTSDSSAHPRTPRNHTHVSQARQAGSAAAGRK